MATVGLLPPDRGNASTLLQGETLGSRFHQLFDCQVEETHRKREKKKTKKKGRGKSKDKKNNKREKSPDRHDVSPPSIELHGNPSSFIIYASVRQAVLERQVKQVSQLYLQASQPRFSDSESEDEADDKAKENLLKMPKIVGIGLCGVFELIKETRISHPALCARALQALLDMLQGQQPEGLKSEPTDVIDSLYELLMDLATSTMPGEPRPPATKSLTSLACACLLSMVIARGDTGKILAAISAALMSPAVLASQEIKVPGIVTALQRSVQAVLLGRTYHPDWLTQGIRDRARTDSILVPQIYTAGSSESAIASDGCFLYIHTIGGLFKIGSGYGDTIKGHIYMSRTDFHPKDKGWLAYAKGLLFYKRLSDTSGTMTTVNAETLQEEGKYFLETRPKGDGYGPNVMFSNGEQVGHVAAAKDDSFVVRTFSPVCNPMPLVSEIPLKLARKCVDVFGSAGFDTETEMHTISTGFDEDAVSIAAGKDFAFIRTNSGKILYTGKAQSLGIKQGGPASGKWVELPITKSPKVVQYSIGHEGQHALLVAEDGSVFFVGTAKRGEDGDSSLSKGRRQPKPVKPKKLIKLEGKHVISSACNSGTSAVITRDGEAYMFGKDTVHCDHASGHVTDLKDVVVTSMSLGKAHAIALTNTGKVFSLGINNKGQCGRDYAPGGAREISATVTMADEEEEVEDDFMCQPGKHRWKQDHCMLCTNCGECTGYGSGCINSGRPDIREALPNRVCGCGTGDSGCAECGVCRTCAGELLDADRTAEAANGGLLEALARSKDMIPLDLLIGRQGARNLDQLSRKLEERRHRIRMRTKAKMKAMSGAMANGKPAGAVAAAAAAAAASSEANNSDYEQDHTKLASLPPSCVEIGASNVTAVQVSCGLQHTVVLLENGEVYTFGSNQYGQLGVGDTNIRGAPTKVSLKATVVQVAAGSNHTLLLTSFGQVYTFGSHKKGQLGRFEDVSKDKWRLWFAVPGLVPGIGAKHRRRATWIGASGDQSYLRIDESLINAHTLAKSNIFANQSCIGLIPKGEDGISSITCLMINTKDGSCKSFNGSEQASLYNQSVCLDPIFDVLWSFSPVTQQLHCYNVLHSEAHHLPAVQPSLCNMLSPELAIPVRNSAMATRSHTALHMLGCLDTLTTAQQLNLTVYEEEKEKQATTKVYTKEDFSTVNRFESHGGGWGYSGHSIEAVRFMPDTDILLGGFGLFGGRGEYFGKIKVFELREDGGENETDGELLAETEEMPYECGAREKYPMLFDEPVLLSANHWYVAWGRISGPSSDCGSGGQLSITTEDQVVFKFKSSKKSNNGTDVNAGQIPQILYRLPAHDSSGVSRKTDHAEPAHILARDFSFSVSAECFDSLLGLLNWSWNTFCAAVSEVTSLKGTSQTAALLDLERLVYISSASLRLSRAYICEVYPSHGMSKKTPSETSRLAECVGDTRTLLWKILADSQRHLEIFTSTNCMDRDLGVFRGLANRILDECHQTFVACFHAFYPTGTLKWACLCDLLAYVEPGQSSLEECGRLLSAVMEALCHPTVKLTALMPINCEHETELILKKQYSTEDNTNNAAQSRDACAFPLLVAHMIRRTDSDQAAHWTFREVLDKLLMIVTMPVRQALNQERVTFAPLLVSNTCSLLSAIISELSASATGSEMFTKDGQTDMQGSGRPLLTTPNRFTRTSPNAYWNPGNGSPDAICFTVDRPGIVIAGVCVYGGGGQYDYDVELLDDQSESSSDVSHIGRWNSLELVKGQFGPEDCVNDIAEIKFDRPAPIKEAIKYAIRLRNRGPRTLNGDGGLPKVKCPDGTTFTFSSCSLSSNGTNHTRGQMPQILYYSAPQEGENQLQNSKTLAELQARKNAIMVASAVIRSAADLLQRAQGFADERLAKLIGSAQIFSVLLPMVVAYISPVAAIDPRGAVQVLGLVQEILPPIAQLNSQLCQQVLPLSPTLPLEGSLETSVEANTTSQHYAIVESDHPYKPATVANYKVTFPDQVKWMALEFDSQCGTAQVEDSLQIYIPARRATQPGLFWGTAGAPQPPPPPPPPPVNSNAELIYIPTMDTQWWPVLHRFHGTAQWPSMAVVLPGNEVCFSLETASDYVKDDKACFYGFKCTVIGYEWSATPHEGLAQLEREVACLGGMCAASLMRKDIILPPACVDEMDEDMESIDEGAQQIFHMHSNLLSKGFALSQPPSINQALEASLPFCWQSNERAFLKDFVSCAPGTSGGRLAAWLQPESYLDPKQCDLVYSRDDLRCSWPAVISVQTKDQYGQVIHVPNLRVEVKAVPVVKETSASDDNRKQRRVSKYDSASSALFGGHPAPRLDTPYQVTVKDKKDAFHAICMMKAYENYSFEELRYAAPVIRRPSENMLVRANNDGTYSANWTPGSVGYYNIHVTIDGFQTGDGYKVEVKDPPQGVAPPSQNTGKKVGHQPNKMRKFVGQWSVGLRVRLNPSLQSEQIGIIKPNGIISFIDEIHNDDGVWLRLSADSIKRWCTSTGGLTEAWALQYNQQLGKTLLVPVDEPKSILDEIIKETILRRMPDLMRDSKGQRSGGPGSYQVVKCGSSGHNIRCRPNLKATPIGMLVLSNQVTATEDVTNGDGTWVKMDHDTMARYCHEVEGEAWALAQDTNDITYLQHEAEQFAEQDPEKGIFGFGPAILGGADGEVEEGAVGGATAAAGGAAGGRGFDFSTAQQTPSFSVFGATPQSSFSPPPTNWPTFGKSEPSLPGPAPHDLLLSVGPTPGGPAASPKVPDRKDSLKDIPPELQGVSVKDLVKALGKVKLEREINKAVGKQLGQSVGERVVLDAEAAAVVHSELRGVSVKDLVRLLGESRVNGNGATPPRTPPGTPKKTASRSSSPKGITVTRDMSCRGSSNPLCPQSLAPALRATRGDPSTTSTLSHGGLQPGIQQGVLTVASPGSPAHTPPRTPPQTPPTVRRVDSYTFSTPPQTPPMLRRDLSSSSASPKLGSPIKRTCYSPQRSSSSSPQRSASPMHLGARAASASPIRTAATAASSLATAEAAIKGHFSIGAASKEDLRLSPKAGRKDRGRTLRSKRERAASPVAKDKTPTSRSRSGSLPGDRPLRDPVKEAMSPSVAECMRAVFASFMWHEGIVHDAMACASFLKFHPNLPKEMPKMKTEPSASSTPSSVGRITPSGTLKKHSRQNSEVANINEAVKAGVSGSASVPPGAAVIVMTAAPAAAAASGSSDLVRSKERCYSESKASESTSDGMNTPPMKATLSSDKESELPVTLQYLVYFWEELSGATLKVITQNLILPSPAVNAKNKRSEKKEKEGKEGKGDKKIKKKKEAKPAAGGRGNLFGEAAGGLFGGGDKETVCELCGGMYPHPITYHMRQTHTGCGRHAGGQGYNSGGNYCGGWAGNCGDGGIGGSTWYLMCARCREKFLREKRQALKDKSKKAKKKAIPGKTPQSVTSILEPHLVMKNNAMFLLDLASATGIILPTQAARGKQGLRLDNVLPSVSEDSLGEHCPFPPVPFLYLVQRGAHAADSAFAEDVIFKSDEFVPTFIENHRHSGDLSNLPRVTRSDSMGSREHRRSTHLTPQEETNPEPGFPSARSAAASPENDTSSPASGRSIIFQRSISEMAGGARPEQVENPEENVNNKVVIRRRNNSGGITDGGMSLLKHPSAPMSKLIQSAEKLAVRPSAADKSLQRPVMSFVIQRHDLDSLQLAMRQALRKAACRVFALQAFNWLVRSVTQPTCLHDLLWFFVASLAPCSTEWDEEEPDVDNKKERKDNEQEKEQSMCEHPLSDITIGGEAVHPLPKTFHTFLQTISDVMMYLPPGSALQQMAVRCWCLKFRPADHIFLHKSHVFSNISKILSKSDEEWGEPANTNENLQQVYGSVECLKDLTPLAELKASSRQAMIVSLTDNSTETFWESGDEDRNKTKSIVVTASAQHSPKMVYVHIDNSRDLGNKVSSVAFNAGPSLDELRKLRQVEVEARHTGWVSCPIPEPHFSVIRLEVKGPDNSLRLRQVKVLGEADGVSLIVSGAQHSPMVMQQKNCEAETLKVFRLLTSQVFGRLIVDESSHPDQKDKKNEGDLDLKEHMVGILFSRSKLTHLQKQVCSHIVQAIRKESQRVQDEWEAALSTNSRQVDEHNRSCDAYCFELLSMVLALSGSGVGRAFLAQQHSLIQNLLSLLHTATPRVQRQVTALLRRVLPEVSPLTLANLLLVPALPPKDYSILSSTDKANSPTLAFDPNRPGVLDVFLACIAKALTVQTKVKGQAGAKGGSFRLIDSLPASMRLPGRWWLRGSISTKQAESIITLLKDMTEGKLSEAWAAVTKGAIAEAILALTKLDEKLRDPNECVKTPTLWLALASLCVLGQEHVERLSSGQWVGGNEPNTPRPTCDNHDDGETSAIILCSECGNLCADCDRFLHLHRRTRSHQRQVFKEEEEAIKVDRHEGCGRTKLFWVMALADSKTLKAMVEFREGNKGKVRGSSVGTCRFCGLSDNTGILAIGNVCSEPECQHHASNACTKVLLCGHPCGGIAAEEQCLPCLHGCLGRDGQLKQDADDMCMVCFTEALAAAPAIQLACGHVFHLHCCKNVLVKGWVGPRITFGFSFCPICKNQIRHVALRDGLESISRLYDDVHRKALMRLEYEGLHKAEAITTVGARFYEDPAGYAMERYAYYVCYKCNKAYYGGEVRCEEQAVQVDQYDPAELVCGACSDVSRAQMCPKHGTDFLEYKCRYCCSVAVFFCFGTTHFCNVCHDDFQRVTNLPKADLPHCPAGPKAKQLEGEECPLHVQHPPTGEEFALGCGVCRNAHTF